MKKSALVSTVLAASLCAVLQGQTANSSPSGLNFRFRSEEPTYSIDVGSTQWFYSKDICARSDYKMLCALSGEGLTLSGGRVDERGQDGYGSYTANSQTYSGGSGSNAFRFVVTARVYDDGETLILKQTFPDGLERTVGDKDGVISKFPSLVLGVLCHGS